MFNDMMYRVFAKYKNTGYPPNAVSIITHHPIINPLRLNQKVNAVHYYQFNIGDYIRETAHLSVAEDCIYRRLIDLYYDTELPIPRETQPVIRRLRINNLDDELGSVLSEYFTLHDDNCWHHARIDRDIKLYKSKADRARKNGKLGGRPSKTKEVNLANPEITISQANHKPLTINHKPLTKDQKKSFAPPNANEVKEYCDERRNDINPQTFIDHYEANGWMRGATKIKNWQACVRTWETKSSGGNNGNQRQKSRAQTVSDKLKDIAEKDIAKNGFADKLD